jgi:hypothetical protein
MKLNDLKTAGEIHREDMKHWSYRWRYYRDWLFNQPQLWFLELREWYSGGGPKDDGGVW